MARAKRYDVLILIRFCLDWFQPWTIILLVFTTSVAAYKSTHNWSKKIAALSLYIWRIQSTRNFCVFTLFAVTEMMISVGDLQSQMNQLHNDAEGKIQRWQRHRARSSTVNWICYSFKQLSRRKIAGFSYTRCKKEKSTYRNVRVSHNNASVENGFLKYTHKFRLVFYYVMYYQRWNESLLTFTGSFLYTFFNGIFDVLNRMSSS